MTKRSLLSFFALAASAGAQQTVGTVTVRPTFTPVNTATQITFTALITDTTLLANGANVQRLNAQGNPTAVLGNLHDDGLDGDAVAGDRIFTLRFTLNEPTPGRVVVRAAAGFPGLAQRIGSSSVAIDIANAASPLSIDASIAPSPNAAGWHRQDPTIAYSCTGGQGGSVSCPGLAKIATEGQAQPVTGTATDGAGNNATKSVTINLDKTAPLLNITSPTTVNTPAITFTGTVTDALSGIASFSCKGQPAALNGPNFSCNLPLVPGVNAIAVQATDIAGNTTTQTVHVTFSTTTLTISATPGPAPNAAGWNNTNVNVAFACSGGSAPVNCPQPALISTEGNNQVISRTATDSFGSTATASVTLKIDKSPPALTVVSPAAAATVANAQLVITGTATDLLAGLSRVTCNNIIASLNGPNFTCNLTLIAGLNNITLQALDIAGNATTRSLNVTLGSTLTISGTPSPAPNAAGWNNGNVMVVFTCAGGTGAITCPANVVVSTEGGNQVLSRTATDLGGGSATASVNLKIDKTAPTLAITSPASGATVANQQLTIIGTVADALSGLASVTCNGSPATLNQGTLTCSRTLIAGLNNIIVTAIDVAGNTTSVTFPVTLNTPNLTISASPAPAPNAAGWNNTDVTVTYACSGGNGALSCPTPVSVTTEGSNQTVSRNVADSTGNSATATVTLRIDKTPPVIAITSPAPNTTVAAAQVTVAGTVNDALAGLAGITCNSASTTAALGCVVTLTPGANNIVVRGVDVAGNVATTTIPITYLPTGFSVTTAVVPAPNVAGWNKTDVTVNFTCNGGTGAVTCPVPFSATAEGANQVISRTATDSAGNTATGTVTLKIDKTPPALTLTAPANNTTVNTTQVTITGTAMDALSGIAAITCNGNTATLTAPNFTCSTTLILGPNTITVTATDVAGNATTQTLTLIYGVPLTITFTTPSNLSYLNLSPTTISGTVSDPNATIIINAIPAPVANGRFSAQVPLAEGPNILTATATTPGGTVATASISVTLDTTPPRVTITNPTDKFVTTEASITVGGSVNDIVVGTVNDQQASVTVNGAVAQVSNRTFLAPNIPLVIGDNTIQATARDRVGNAATTQITVTRQAPTLSQLRLLSGNLQSGTIGGTLPAPLTVAVTDATGNPLANKPVIFKVTQNNGLLAAGGQPTQAVIANTNAQGQAEAQWTLGLRAGAGGNTVEAYAVGIPGTAMFTATGNQGPAGKIVVDSGDAQYGAIGQPLPKPLIAVVVDNGNNRLLGVPVTFKVIQGGGSFAGQNTFTTNTDSDGRAAAMLTLGFQEGNANNVIQASFTRNQGFPAAFTASGRAPGLPANTTISGVVLDNSNVPIPGVTIRAVLTNQLNSNTTVVAAAASVQTNVHGQFTISPAPVGFVKLLVDGSTAQRPGTYPHLDYDMVTVVGQKNTLGLPIYLLPLNDANKLCVTQSTGGGTLTIPEAPGFSLTFGPGQVTFPGGSKTGCVSVTVVHGDKVPMVPGFGQQPRFIVTIQPAGAVFNPPAPITIPNVDELTPRAVTEMYSFDHDIGSFVAIGTGAVSDDGQIIRSNPGVGVLKAGWHCGGNPNILGAAATCGTCAFCDGTTCQPNPTRINATCLNPCLTNGAGRCSADGYCSGETQPVGTICNSFGGRCDSRGQCTGGQCPSGCNSGSPCVTDSCVSGQCVVTQNQRCQDACAMVSSGVSCNVGGLTGTCASGSCQLCAALGSGAPCNSGGVALGSCGTYGASGLVCKGSGNQCPLTCNGRQCVNGECREPLRTFTVWLKTFIPYTSFGPLSLITPIIGLVPPFNTLIADLANLDGLGDGRGFSSDRSASFRSFHLVQVDDVDSVSFTETKRLGLSQGRNNLTGTIITFPEPSDASLTRPQVSSVGSGLIAIRFQDSAQSGAQFIPSIDLDLQVLVNVDARTCSVSGAHDGFPAYEVYIEADGNPGIPCYTFDPGGVGLFPTQMVKLLPPLDVFVAGTNVPF